MPSTPPTAPPTAPTTPPATDLPVSDLRSLVLQYRGSSPEAAAQAAGELLTRFQPYLDKWLRLLLLARWDRGDGELRAFLKLIGTVDDPTTTAELLRNRLRAYDRADLEQELKVALLGTFLKYDDLQDCFRYVLRQRIVELTRDPLVFQYYLRVKMPEEVADPMVFGAAVDEEWVEGKTCSAPFLKLTYLQRKVLQLHYWERYTVQETAEILSLSPRQVKRLLSVARESLKGEFLEA